MDKRQTLVEEIETATLTDLPLASEQAAKTKAGGGDVSLIGPPESELTKAGPGKLILPINNV